MPTQITDRLISWASDIADNTLVQAARTSRLPVVYDHVALMPDAHVGIGATVGSVVPTRGAIIPSCVGVGCGMAAVELDVTADQLPDDLGPLMPRIEATVPAGLGKDHGGTSDAADSWLGNNPPPHRLTTEQVVKTLCQFGTLGSGNHFFEVCLDERDHVWVVLHSGSRGIGNQLAQSHIAGARRLAKDLELRLEDPDLAYFMEGTSEFEAYIADMLWAQNYAAANRAQMMTAALTEVLGFIGHGHVVSTVNCHHNFSERETHGGVELWVTRKGAIKADVGDMGIIPGSMGTSTFIVAGLGNPASWNSCSHGAGRRFSRSAAKKRFTADDLAEAMAGKTWQADNAGSLIDEIPAAYKDVHEVMRAQADLVEVRHTLHQILNYKGTK